MATIGLVSLESARAQGNLVVNGAFDSDFSGWMAYNCLWIGQGKPSGYVSLIMYPDAPASLSQTIYGLTIGNTYIVSGDYSNGSSTSYQNLEVSIDGVPYVTVAGTGQELNWSTFNFSFIAGSATMTLDIVGSISTMKGYWFIDNISMVAVPEPGSLCLLGLGVAGGLLFQRRKKGLQI